MVDLLDRRGLRGAAMLLVGASTVACAKLNAAYVPEGEAVGGDATGLDPTTGSAVDDVTTNAGSGSDRPDPTGASPTTDDSDTAADSGSESSDEGSGESSGEDDSSTTDGQPAIWNPSCSLGIGDQFCPATVVFGPDIACGLGPFLPDGGNDCGRPTRRRSKWSFRRGSTFLGPCRSSTRRCPVRTSR